MDALDIDGLRTLAKMHGLTLTDEELTQLLPLVRAGRSLMDALRDAAPPEIEPASQYRML